MSNAYAGGCACAAIRYEISGEPVFMNHCQCQDCQRRSGTGHGSYLTFAGKKSVKLDGKAAHCDVVGDSGNVKTHGFCPACGSPVYLTFAAMPDLFTVHAASLDDPGSFQTASRHLRNARSRLGPSRSGRADIRQNAAGRFLNWPFDIRARSRAGEAAFLAKKLSGACRLWRFPIVLEGESQNGDL